MKYILAAIALTCAAPAAAEIHIVVDRSDLELKVYQDGELIQTKPVAMGKPGDATPLGTWRITQIDMNPDWYSTRRQGYILPGPEVPLGRVRMRYDGVYALHGTNNPASIGTYASLGCIRMHNEDVIELAKIIFKDTGSYKGDSWFQHMLDHPLRQFKVPLNRYATITVKE